jgi:LysM repeat protein
VAATYAGPLSAAYAELPAVASVVDAQAAARSYDYYRYQGEWDSGAMASSNCGPTSVAMAIQFARNNLWVPISEVRTYIGGSSWTYASSLRSALNHWGVTNRTLGSLADMDAALARGSIVLAHVWMYYLSPGADHMVAMSSPAGNTNRYHRYDQSHWLVLKGISADGQWVIVHDPNVWDGNGVYWYSGNLAKGRDRLYRYSELAAAITAYNMEFLEVPDGGAAPSPTATPAVTVAPPTGVPTGGVWHTVRSGENLYRISLSYGTTVAAIAAANGLADPNRIYIGQQLWIPLAGGATPVPTSTRTLAPSTLTPSTATPVAPSATPAPPTPTAIPPTATPMPPTATPTRVMSPTPAPTPLPGTGVWHTVTWGDTLGGIATRYGVPVQAIMQANGLTNPNLIRIGQRLWIPQGGAGATPTATVKATLTATPGVERWHVVQRGDTLSSIATQYGTTWQSIAQANGLNAWSVIYPGQRLRIP